jgi:hypothetical protein
MDRAPAAALPEVLFEPAFLALGAELARRPEEVRWLHWERGTGEGERPWQVDGWLALEAALLVHWFPEGFRHLAVEEWGQARLRAHLVTRAGVPVGLDLDAARREARPSLVRARLGDETWSAWRRADGRNELVVVLDPEARTRREGASGERRVPLRPDTAGPYRARYQAAREAGTAREFFGAAGHEALAQLACDLGQAHREHAARLGALGEVVLVQPPRHHAPDDVVALAPLGLARLQAALRPRGFAVRLVDLEALTLGQDRSDLEGFHDDRRVEAWLAGGPDPGLEVAARGLLERLELHGRPAAVGFSLVDVLGRFQPNLVAGLARGVKARWGAGVPVVAGGDFEAVRPEFLLAQPGGVDHVVFGDGEVALADLVQAAAWGDRPAEAIPGHWFAGPGGGLVRGRRARVRFRDRGQPDFTGVPLERYRRGPSAALRAVLAERHPGLAGYADQICYLPYYFVEGCSAHCVFCSFGHYLDLQEPDKSVREVLELSERHQTDCFYLLDTTANVSRRHLAGFVEGLLRSNRRLHWTDSARAQAIDDDLARGMAEAGCVMLSFGVESGSDAVLQRMRKGFSAEEAAAALQATHRAGILNRVNLIAGFFHETDQDVADTERFLDENHAAIDVIGCFQGFYLFPGMDLDPLAMGIHLHDALDVLPLGQVSRTYDEVGGLEWPAKREQIRRSHERVQARLDSLGVFRRDKVDDYDLFHLARLFPGKAERRALLLESSRRGPA